MLLQNRGRIAFEARHHRTTFRPLPHLLINDHHGAFARGALQCLVEGRLLLDAKLEFLKFEA